MNIQEKYVELMRLYGILRFNAGKSENNFALYLAAFPIIMEWQNKYKPKHTAKAQEALYEAYL